MKNIAKNLLPAAALMLSATAQAGIVDFENESGYTSIGVFDIWEESPFNTGALQGNFAITDNPDTHVDEASGEAPNGSAKVFGAQRSRFGSNRFGARVDLSEDNFFALTPTAQYVHVKLLSPTDGRVMLIGLGSRDDDPEQDLHVVQFQTMSNNRVNVNQWTDMVFGVKGAGGITVRSLVLVPHCESPHELTSDFLFYIDDIELNNSSTPSIQTGYYPINADKESTLITRSGWYTNSISVNSQTLKIDQSETKKLYHQLETPVIATPGQTMNVQINFTPGNWMHAYVYFDTDLNGKFNYDLTADGLPAEGSELMSFSYYGGKNSAGTTQSDYSSATTLPTFTLPASLTQGVYRMRVKLDWENVDPAGNAGDASGNNKIESNGGVIVDIPVVIVDPNSKVSIRDNQLNGEVLTEDGSRLSGVEAPALQPFTVKMNPAVGFGHIGADVYYGFGLSDDQFDKFGNQQWFTRGFDFRGETYTFPGDVIFGEVRIEGRMTEDAKMPADATGYELNFDRDLPHSRTDRHLNSVTFENSNGGEETTIEFDQTTVYIDATAQAFIDVQPGDNITLKVDYTGDSMHGYIYVDWDRDIQFDYSLNEDGTPAGELLSYTYYNGKDSKGMTITNNQTPRTIQRYPFTVPGDIPNGLYVCRYKIDWNNIDPKGQWTEGGTTNQIDDNGGAIVDFTIRMSGSTVDSIREIDANSTESDLIYDLQGRRVLHPTHGIYIQGGRKILL